MVLHINIKLLEAKLYLYTFQCQLKEKLGKARKQTVIKASRTTCDWPQQEGEQMSWSIQGSGKLYASSL